MKTITKVKNLSLLLLLMCVVTLAHRADAQSPTNLYAFGPSWNQAGTPQVAGSALYAHAISPDTTGMYAFSVIDLLPSGTKPFTVTTNIGAGIAEKVATIAGADIYIPTAAGISFSGTNTGWAWTAGAAAAIPIKTKSANGNWYIMPTVRVAKSSVSGGTGYQPIIGVLVAWGK